MRRLILALVTSLTASACGSGPAPNNGLGFRDRSLLSAEEIEKAHTSGTSAWDLISQLRPEYLRARGSVSLRDAGSAKPVVYVNDMRFGDVESLRRISVDDVFFVRYVNAADATTRFGTNHLGGAILITTK